MAFQNKVIYCGLSKLTLIGNKPSYKPYMKIETSGGVNDTLSGPELRGLTVSLMKRLDIKEAGRTVRAKRPVQQRKGAIRPCCDICKKSNNCGWRYQPGCGFRRVTAPVA
jgi:hypothetical protein